MEFRLLGSLEVVAHGERIEVGGRKPRTLLAALLVRPNEVIPAERLIDALWGERPPETAQAALQVHISSLRKALGADRIVTRAPGYRIRVETDELDAQRFERLLAEARELGPPSAGSKLREALALWRGPPLADFAHEPFARGERSRLEQLQVEATETCIDADLADGHHVRLLPELDAILAEHPHRERSHAQRMLALYRAGRQAEALDAYRAARTALVEKLGIEPGPELRRLERAILDHDPDLDLPAPATAPRPERAVPGARARETSFVGRRRELREIRALLSLDDGRLVTLTGPPGAGKTRLAVELLATTGAEFQDGATFVELAPLGKPNLVALAICDALGVQQKRGLPPTETLVASLRGRRALVVLDNFEHVLAAAPLLADVLYGAPMVKLLVTSRAPLDLPDERLYPLPALQLPGPSSSGDLRRLRRIEAVRLFVDRGRAARADFDLTEANAGAVSELCARLDGLPLPLELAAARLRLLAPAVILERLGRRLELLKASPGSGLPARHRTLRSAIEWSCDLLPAGEQALLTRLGVFVGGFTLEGAEAVAGDLDLDLVDGIESLLTNSLVVPRRTSDEQPRFGMLETIREFALECLEESGDDEAIRLRHARFYLSLAERAEPGLFGAEQLGWLRRLDTERDNFRAALRWATQSGEAEVGLRTASALWRYWQFRAADAEGREYIDRLLAGGGGSPSTRAGAQSRAASLTSLQGDHAAVRSYLETSVPVHRALKEERSLAGVLGLFGMVLLADGETDRARALIDEAFETARRIADPLSEAQSVAQLGHVLAAEGDLDGARRRLEDAVRRAREIGNVRSVANWSRDVGGIALLQDDRSEARRLWEESLAVHRAFDDPWPISACLANLAFLALDEGDLGSARGLIQEAVTIDREAGFRDRMPNTLELAARLAAAEERPSHAARLQGAASAARESLGRTFCMIPWPDPERDLARLHAVLGNEAFDEEWARGRAMSLDEALPFAVSGQPESEVVA